MIRGVVGWVRLAVLVAWLVPVSWPGSAGAEPRWGPGPSGAPHDFFVVGSGPLVPLPRPDRVPVALPPVYPAPPPGFRALPPGSVPFPLAGYVVPGTGRAWIPARTDVIVGVDAEGRIVHILEHTPGHFR